jgi:Na+/H+-translocating membrane pyrophosphatase
MNKIALAIQTGARAFLIHEYRTLVFFIIPATIVLAGKLLLS